MFVLGMWSDTFQFPWSHDIQCCLPFVRESRLHVITARGTKVGTTSVSQTFRRSLINLQVKHKEREKEREPCFSLGYEVPETSPMEGGRQKQDVWLGVHNKHDVNLNNIWL